MDRPLWTHVQPLMIPTCPNYHRGHSIEMHGNRQLEHRGLREIVIVRYRCTECDTEYSLEYKLSTGSPGSGVVYLSSNID
jgi:transposase-like protein